MSTPDPARGVYETLFARDGAVQALTAHVERMQGSIERLYELPPPDGLTSRIRERAARLGAGGHRLRVDVRPEGDGLEIGYRTAPLPPRRPFFHLAPLACPGGHSPDKLADRGALTNSGDGGPTPLLVDGAEVLEAAWANVWLLDGDRLVTPPIDGRILPGVTRARVMALGLNVTEAPVTLDRLADADLMLTSSLQLAAPAVLEGAAEPTPAAQAAIAEIRAALLDSDWE